MSASKEFKKMGSQHPVELDKFARMHPSGLHAPFLLNALAGRVTASDVDWIGGPIYVCGEGPWPKTVFLRFLQSRFFSCVDHPAFCNAIAIGTENFHQVELDQFKGLGSSQRVFPQELLVLGLMTRADPYTLLSADVLKHIEANHAGISAIGHPRWSRQYPGGCVLAEGLCGPYNPTVILRHEWEDRAFLRAHGYEGEGSIPMALRRAVLKRILTENLHGIESPDYAYWGYRRSIERLAALVSFLLYLNKVSSASLPALRKVRAEDVLWLRQKFDTDQALFEWPELTSEL
ncbi:hypothetical protein PE066_04345 [Ramlibacter tataouinensis]|uniref:hypothetical protein n=1 Tax=Ramlibacter tataouinensis TaxID=94132 RepID=UPI0022F3F34C|nr:hypothetical protein [Ramlibacter tataouinensis]WBY02775.1 hypothetical protein PE066_04345 [Ramlibacter tataouinensis]